MPTAKQKTAAGKNIVKARKAQSTRAGATKKKATVTEALQQALGQANKGRTAGSPPLTLDLTSLGERPSGVSSATSRDVIDRCPTAAASSRRRAP